jgi:uncharacterized membrane protein YqjE
MFPAMATVPRLPAAPADGLLTSLTRLASLELELGIAEARRLGLALAVTLAVALGGAVALIAAAVVLLVAAIAPAFGVPWPPFVIVGGVVALASLVAVAWSVRRLRRLPWPERTLASLEETWRWLGAQVRSRLT